MPDIVLTGDAEVLTAARAGTAAPKVTGRKRLLNEASRRVAGGASTGDAQKQRDQCQHANRAARRKECRRLALPEQSNRPK